jgi:predicted kinase
MIVVCYGLPGTGKTTVGRALAAALSCPSLGTDAIRRRVLPEPTYTFAEREMIYRVLFFTIELLHGQGIDVVIDGTFTHRKLRRQIVELGESLGAPVRFVECVCPPDIAVQRIAGRKNSDSDARAETYHMMTEDWETNDHAYLEIDTTVPVEQNVVCIREYLAESARLA